jgi:radical SAM superfamily enzyme YgiQ (UPF0313 family)
MGRRKNSKAIYPLELLYLATALAKKHTVQIFDPNMHPLSASSAKLVEAIDSFRPDIVGVSIKYFDTTNRLDPFIFYNTIAPMVNQIKSISPKALIIVGGPAFSIFPKEIISDIDAIDYGAFLEGEVSLPMLLENLDRPECIPGIFYRQNGKIFSTGYPPKIDFSKNGRTIINPAILDISSYISSDADIFGIQSKRGCVFECAYCNYPFLDGSTLRLRDPIDVAEEIEYLVKNYGLKAFTFADNIFNIPSAHAKDICREIIRRKIRVEWAAWFDLSDFSEDLVNLAYGAGCRHMGISPDAATQEGLKWLGKRYNVDAIKKSITSIRQKKNMKISYYFFAVYPGQTVKGAIKLTNLSLRIFISLLGRADICWGWIRMLPNTRIYDWAVKKKYLERETKLFVKSSDDLIKTFYQETHLWAIDLYLRAMVYITRVFITGPMRIVHKLLRRIKIFSAAGLNSTFFHN